MKKTYLIWLVSAVILLAGCEKFLGTLPDSSTTVDNFYKTPEDIELALTGCYNAITARSMQDQFQNASYAWISTWMGDLGTDEAVLREGFNNPNFPEFGVNGVLRSNECIRYNWFYTFAGIYRCNMLLSKIDAVEDFRAARKKEILAEARLLRAFFYFHLARCYGAVPVYTSVPHDMKAPRNSIEEVYTQVILPDFEHAYRTLSHRSTIAGRADKWSAGGFLAKAKCQLASCKLSGVNQGLNFPLNDFDWVDADLQYEEARQITDDIITNSGYKLAEDVPYSHLFYETTTSAKRQEFLFGIEGTASPIAGHPFMALIHYLIPVGNSNVSGGGFGWFRPTKEVSLKYDKTVDFRGSWVVGGSVNNGDLEDIGGVKYYKPTSVNALPDQNSHCINKFRYRDPKSKTIELSAYEGVFPLLRYADILLLDAEASYYVDGDEIRARERLTEIRQRATNEGEDYNQLNSVYYRANFLDELLEERSRELCFESQRRYDLIRFGKAQEKINALVPGPGWGNRESVLRTLKENWAKPYRIWFPIPGDDTVLNPNLVQNPGYALE